ncbi:protein MIGRI [Deefgea salmonis]|uniref:protein MIGRI n=1 Tax=Deefgea salmonis TaxID=2875502 RepID=UPI00402BF098
MSSKLLYLCIFLLTAHFAWRRLHPAHRKELHRISKISAATLIAASMIAITWHFFRA